MTERLTDKQLAELRTIADSAAAWYPGRWEHLPGIDWEALVASKEASIADVGSPVCAAHIAAFDPPTVIALLDAVRERDGYRESLRVAGNAMEEVVAERDELQARLDRIEALHHAVDCEPSETICAGCSTLRGAGSSARYFPYTEWPCPTVTAARGEV